MVKHLCIVALAALLLLPSLSTRAGDLQLHMISFTPFSEKNPMSPAQIIIFFQICKSYSELTISTPGKLIWFMAICWFFFFFF